MRCKAVISFLIAFQAAIAASVPAFSQEWKPVRDTLVLRILFQSGNGSNVDLSYEDNAARLASFGMTLDQIRAERGVILGVHIRTSSSPEGRLDTNKRLARERGASVTGFLSGEYGIPREFIRVESIGEDWEGVAQAVAAMDVPWKEEALSIIASNPGSIPDGSDDPRKAALKKLDEGRVWKVLVDGVFPYLRAARCDTYVVVLRNVREGKERTSGFAGETVTRTDTVYVDRVVEKVVEKVVEVELQKKPKPYDLAGRKMWFALRTNILAVPLANVGVEVPIGKHLSVGGDWYYPWIWRNDLHKDCFEFLGGDIEFRYWFEDRKARQEQRLVGFSIGLYGAAGHYDFERNWMGYQGWFYNVGLDFLYAVPVWGGRMHLEFELGLGYIHSPATPYECLEPYGDCYRIMGTQKQVNWIGPTRAQVSLVVPFYFKTRKGGAQ